MKVRIQCNVSDWLQNFVDEEKEVRKGSERRGKINSMKIQV